MKRNHSELLQELLAKPVGPAVSHAPSKEGFTSQVEVSGNSATVTTNAQPGEVNEGTAAEYLRKEGLDSSEWQVTGFKRSEWGDPDSPKESCSFTFKRVGSGSDREPVDVDALAESYARAYPLEAPREGSGDGSCFVLALGDFQYGKADGDGVEGTIRRVFSCINNAAARLEEFRRSHDISDVHIAFLGDCQEGFVSQGGNNAWRTTLPLTEQIRLTRRTMLHAMGVFAPLAGNLSIVSVPGNHDEAVRFGSSTTTFDDSFATESLIAVQDAARLVGEPLDHVKFYVPETDDLSVTLERGNTVFTHHHGHKWPRGKHFTWWREQAFHNDNLAAADVLLAAHLHQAHIEADGGRLFAQIPALESESTWWRLSHGSVGAPGVLVGLAKDHRMDRLEIVRGTA